MNNIAELLKDAPKGMKLYSPLFGEVEYCYIGGTDKRIWVCTKASMRMFSKDGRYCFTHDGNTIESTECLLFPNENCRTWIGWELPVKPNFKVGDWIIRNNGSSIVPIQVYDLKKDRYLVTNTLDTKGEVMLTRQDEWHLWNAEDATDGDVLVTENYIFIFKYILHGGVHLYCHYDIDGEEFDFDIPDAVIGNIHDKGAHFRPATQQQRNLFFKKMQEAGYQWYAGKKELKKIQVEPKFKVGDWITNGTFTHYIVSIVDGFYYFYGGGYLDFGKIDGYYHLWTIADAKDGDVLARNWHEDGDSWEKIIIFKNYHTKGVKGLFKDPCVEGYGNTFKNGKLAFREEVPYYSKTWTDNLQPATAKQRDLLFQKMKENGCEWDADKKELHKIKHYDISSFYAGMPVLVRADNICRWDYSLFSRITGNEGWPFAVCNGVSFSQCIPFNEDTKHLLGTTDMCPKEYINW